MYRPGLSGVYGRTIMALRDRFILKVIIHTGKCATVSFFRTFPRVSHVEHTRAHEHTCITRGAHGQGSEYGFSIEPAILLQRVKRVILVEGADRTERIVTAGGLGEASKCFRFWVITSIIFKYFHPLLLKMLMKMEK